MTNENRCGGDVGNLCFTKGPKGFALVAVLFCVSILLFLGAASVRLTRSERIMASDYADYVAAYYIAEGGMHRTFGMLQEDPKFGSDKKWRTFPLGEGSYKVQVTPESGGKVSVTVQGFYANAKTELAAKALVESKSPEEPGEEATIQVTLVEFSDHTWP